MPVPDPDIQKTRKRIILAGDPPSPLDPPTGCRFHTRCPIAQGICSEKLPEFKEVAPGHCCACHFAEPFPDRRNRTSTCSRLFSSGPVLDLIFQNVSTMETPLSCSFGAADKGFLGLRNVLKIKSSTGPVLPLQGCDSLIAHLI